MRKCKFCGEHIDKGLPVCPWCGRRQHESAPGTLASPHRIPRTEAKPISWLSFMLGLGFLSGAVMLYVYFASAETSGGTIVLPRIAIPFYLLLGKWPIVTLPLLGTTVYLVKWIKSVYEWLRSYYNPVAGGKT